MATQVDSPENEVQELAPRGGPGLLQIAWQRKSLVILGIMLGLVLGLLYYAQRAPTYQSIAQVLIVKKSAESGFNFGDNRGDSRVAYMEDYMSTQSMLVKSPKIIERALQLPKMGDLKSYPGESGPELIYTIHKNLTVVRDSRDNSTLAQNNILTLQFLGPNPEECRTIVESVIESYQNFLNDTYRSVSDRTLELIQQANDTLQKKVEVRQQEYTDFRQKNPFIMIKTKEGVNIYTERLAKFEAERAVLLITQKKLTDQIGRIEKAFEGGKNKEAAMQAILSMGVNPRLLGDTVELDKNVMQYKILRQKLLSTYGPNHPQIKELEDTISEIMKIYRRGAGATDGDKKTVIRDPEDPASYLVGMKQELDFVETTIKSLDTLFDKESKAAKELNNLEVEEERLRKLRDSSEEMLRAIVKRVQELSLIKDFGGYDAKAIAPPGVGRKVAPNALTVFPLAGIAGLVLGLCLAYLAEMSDKSFRTPAEIRRRLGLPVIGHIPFYGPDEKATKQVAGGEHVVDPMLCTHYQSNSVSSEAYRSVRTALYFNTHGVGHQVIQVTSPNVSDGKSTLAANLAISIAQSGKRTILIDADCRRPRAHKLFNVSAESGLATVIAGQSDLASVIKPTAIPNLSLMPCGPRPANPAELLTSPRFKELLDIIRSQYDFVVVDTPPLLVVTDPCVVAPRVDGVILAIRVTKNGRPFAERAKEILGSLGANVLGVVVNGLGSPSGGKYGYGYDQYQYGYGYTYRYSYTYADEYSDDKAASYYNTGTGEGAEASKEPAPAEPLETK